MHPFHSLDADVSRHYYYYYLSTHLPLQPPPKVKRTTTMTTLVVGVAGQLLLQDRAYAIGDMGGITDQQIGLDSTSNTPEP